MKFQCTYCRKRMEPKVVKEERLTTADQETLYCSQCGKQLIVLGGFWGKAFTEWNPLTWIIALLPLPIWDAIRGSEILRNLLQRYRGRKQ